MAAIIPVLGTDVEDVLYGDRYTSYRWEVLTHNPSTGLDSLAGELDGVSDASLSWTLNAAVKGSGKGKILDLAAADTAPGKLRVGALALESVRVRPVQVIDGLPENPLGVFLLSSAKEEWSDTGRTWAVSLLDRTTVPQQDRVSEAYSVAAGTLILQKVAEILDSCGEYIAVNASSTLATSSGMVWEAGTSKLKIINDLLDVAGYNALWMDGYGNFQTTPRVLPADRPTTYDLLGLPRELRDGQKAIYLPTWARERDSFDVPNEVIATEAANGDTPALSGSWQNTDPTSKYSIPSRGRTISYPLDGVEVPAGTDPEKIAFLQQRARATLISMSAVQAQVKIEHLPIPSRVSEVLRFANSTAGVDAKHVMTNISLDLHPLGLQKTTLQEVISL